MSFKCQLKRDLVLRFRLFPDTKITELSGVLSSGPDLSVVTVRKPYEGAEVVSLRLGKSYVWWLDDPWAALIAIAAISILLCLVGIIVLIFTHSRYVYSNFSLMYVH